MADPGRALGGSCPPAWLSKLKGSALPGPLAPMSLEQTLPEVELSFIVSRSFLKGPTSTCDLGRSTVESTLLPGGPGSASVIQLFGIALCVTLGWHMM